MARTKPAATDQVARTAASESGLQYVTDASPGFRRTPLRNTFRYSRPNGRPLKDPSTLRRIKTLAIPPAWTQVWICPDPTGHLQATGRDARGRKQYRYHPRWRQTRDENKFSRMIEFGRALPAIRQRVRKDLRTPGLGREKILASIVQLLELSSFRIGNEEYASANRSYGLTTLRDRHATIKKSRLRLRFRGKGGKENTVDLRHPRLARIVKACQDLPGQQLFQCLDDRSLTHNVTSNDVNAYLADITGSNFTAKDFRTWTGTVFAAQSLTRLSPGTSPTAIKRNIVTAIQQVAEHLGNTAAICKKCYVHPAVIEAYSKGTLQRTFAGKILTRGSLNKLKPEERAVMGLLLERLRETNPTTLISRLSASLRQSPPKSSPTPPIRPPRRTARSKR